MNLQKLFDKFNASKFLVFTSLFFFVLLLALKFDDLITWSNWIIFFPLWIWKLITISGFVVGVSCYVSCPQYRNEGLIHFKAMFWSTLVQLILLIAEILTCMNMESKILHWLLVCIPYQILGILSVGLCIWLAKNQRSFELELFFAANILLFVFIPLKLDKWVDWSWGVVFIPLWILMSIVIIIELCSLVLAIIVCHSSYVGFDEFCQSLTVTLGYAGCIFPVLLSEILLALKFDGLIDSYYISICLPLLFGIFVMICLSFHFGGGNQWWFGIRKSFCHRIIEICPFLQEYGNVVYKISSLKQSYIPRSAGGDDDVTSELSEKKSTQLKMLAQNSYSTPQYINIYMPD